MKDNVEDALLKRRSIYHLGNQEVIPDSDIVKLIELAVKNCPSAFNSQASRVVVLFAEEHKKLWTIVTEILQKIVPAENFSATKEKINSFSKGRGTILYFADKTTVKNLQNKFPLYKDNFPIWAEQANGMLQFAIWTLLAEKNVGANLQHYNPLIDEEIHKNWNLPDT